MGKVIVPKNHTLVNTTNHDIIISTTNETINANINPTYTYADGNIIIDETINYTLISDIIYTASDINYRINLFDSTSEDNNEVRFIKLNLTRFPIYMDNRTQTGSVNLLPLSVNINIYKKSSSTSSDCSIRINFPSINGRCSVNGTYWLTFDTSTKKYTVSSTPSTEPLLISKAIVPNKDNWMDFNTVTEYSPSIQTRMSISTGDRCNQPYIGRMIHIENYSSSNITISTDTTYRLTINTKDKILGIRFIGLGNFIGKQYSSSAIVPSSQLTLNIFINNNSTAVYSKVITITDYASDSVPTVNSIGISELYIDVKNNKTITKNELSKAIDIF